MNATNCKQLSGGYSDLAGTGFFHCQDSDVDSGIVAFSGSSDRRTASTSSTDTESNSSPPAFKDNGYVRRPEFGLYRASVQQTPGPKFSSISNANDLETDHQLKECLGRPPTPLSVIQTNSSRPRFDDHPHLSEQTLRRSCRKLFATLYAQRSPPATKGVEEVPDPSSSMCMQARIEQRARSRTLSDFELRKCAAVMLSDRAHPYWWNRAVASSGTSMSGRDNSRCKKMVTWNLNANQCNCTPESSVLCNKSNPMMQVLVPSHHCHPRERSVPVDLSTESKKCCCSACRNSLDNYEKQLQGRSSCKRPFASPIPEHPSHNTTSSSHPVFHSVYNHNQQQCFNCGSTKSAVSSSSSSDDRIGTLSKSASCSILPTVAECELTRLPPREETNSDGVQKLPDDTASLQRIPSCSHLQKAVESSARRDNAMMKVYARVASVVPENAYYIPTKDVSRKVLQNRISSAMLPDTCPCAQCKARKISVDGSSEVSATAASLQSAAASKSPSSPHVESCSCPSVHLRADHSSQSRRTHNASTAAIVAAVRPTPIEISTKENFKILSKPLILAKQERVSQVLREQENLSANREVEYAVVDKSKKNRFSSLPTLNRSLSSSINQDDKEQQPPVPPKKNLHKSDFCLSDKQDASSPARRGFFGRFHELTKNAKSAFQKAFSTERIYRPEKEERLEAGGKLQRTKSFMRGIRASMSRKRKKSKTPIAEVVPQASSSSVWDEEDLSGGTDFRTHVRGQLLQLNLDGSQVVELCKAPNKPYGFFVARGRVRNSKGVFVSRMRDQETQKQLAGLLDIGDEILEVEGLDVRNADIMEVNDLISKKNTLLLTVLPYICRKDI